MVTEIDLNSVFSIGVSSGTLFGIGKYLFNQAKDYIDNKFIDLKKEIIEEIIKNNIDYIAKQKQVINDIKQTIADLKDMKDTLSDIKINNESEKYQFLTKIDNLFHELQLIESTFNSVDKNTVKMYEYIEKMKDFINEINNQLKIQSFNRNRNE